MPEDKAIARKVRAPYWSEEGEIIKWEPLGAGMCDALVRLEDGSEVWYAMHCLQPTDGLGPLPSRGESIRRAEAEKADQLRAIAKRWQKGGK